MKKIGNREYLTELNEIIDPAHTAVLVIDQQNDFCHPKGYYAEVLKLDVSMTRGMTGSINQLTAAARAKGAMVIFSQFVIGKGFATDSPMWLAMHANAGLKSLDQERFYTMDGTWGVELYEDMVVEPTDHIIRKYRASCFKDTFLEFLLKQRGIKTLIIAGQVTEGCVESTIRAARDTDYYTVLAKDVIGSTSRERHDRVMAGWLGRTPCPTTAEIIATWNGAG